MLKNDPYQNNAEHYDKWFEKNRWVYDAELKAVRSLLPPTNRISIEIGVGTGRFAVPTGIRIGIEPCESMGKISQRRGIEVVRGIAEKLPLKDSSAALVVMVTVICFVSDIHETFKESFRVLSEGGDILVAMIDRNSPGGQNYLKHKHNSLFYKHARFYSVDEVIKIMRDTGFSSFEFRQTVFHDIAEINENEIVTAGHGEGLFAVIRGKKIIEDSETKGW